MPRTSTTGARGPLRIAILSLLLVSACAYQPQPDRQRPRPVTLEDVSAPGGDQAELRWLDRQGDGHAVLLRRAWILQKLRRGRAAVRACNRVLFHRHAPTRSMKAMALLIRGQSFLSIGDRRRAEDDLAKADAMAIHKQLKSRTRSALASLRPAPKPAAARPSPAGHKARILPRSAWGPRPVVARALEPMGSINKLTIHHSAILCRSSKAAVRAHLKILQRGHIVDRQWADIGYHFLIDPAGRIWTGRELRYQGAHAKGWRNKHNVGICLLGNFIRGPGGNHPSAPQLASMRQLIRALQSRYDIPGSGIKTHQELVSSTECPGPRLQIEVDRFRAQLAQRRPRQQAQPERLLAGREEE